MDQSPLKSGEDIAVIGFSFKGPGDAASSSAFWKMLLEGRFSMTDVPHDRFNIDKFCVTKGEKSGTVCRVSSLELRPQSISCQSSSNKR